MPTPRRRARHATATQIAPTHHAQARIPADWRSALAQLAEERGVSESEIVRDAIGAYLFGLNPGATMTGPDQGYRIAKATAGVIAKKMLHRAYEGMPETFEDFQRLVEEEGV